MTMREYKDMLLAAAAKYDGKYEIGQQIDLYCAGKRCFNFENCEGRKAFDRLAKSQKR